MCRDITVDGCIRWERLLLVDGRDRAAIDDTTRSVICEGIAYAHNQARTKGIVFNLSTLTEAITAKIKLASAKSRKFAIDAQIYAFGA